MSTKEKLTIVLPKLGESIKQATILNWLVKVGDSMEEGQVLLEVATDKVDSEVPAPATGRLLKIYVEEDEVVQVGAVIAEMEVNDKTTVKAAIPDAVVPQKPDVLPKAVRIETPPAQKSLKEKEIPVGKAYFIPGRNDNRFYSPLVRNIALQHGISYQELARIPAGGNKGRLRKSDIVRYIKEGRSAQFAQTMPIQENPIKVPNLKFDKGKGRIVEMDRMAGLIADHMVFSKHRSPHVTAFIEADMTKMVAWKNTHKQGFQEKYGEKLTFTPLFVKAVAMALKDFPMINSSLDGRNIIVKDSINIGIGAALPSGNLIVPVIKEADQKDLPNLAAEVNELVDRARNNNLKPADIEGGTFTISNVGTFGSLMGTPIINQPQAAILATGAIKKRAEVVEYETGDKIEIRPMMYLCLSFDHSFIGGHLAGSFLKRVAQYFEDFGED